MLDDPPSNLRNRFFYLVGIKGTGMAALAEILKARGARVEGCDTKERFYTDAILEELGIPFAAGFAAKNLPETVDGVIYSAAYSPESQPVLAEARNRGLALWEYPHFLGSLSRGVLAAGIAGVHGKTTTTALTGMLIKVLELPATVLVGSAVSGFGNRSTLIQGNRAFIAETCEYRRNFLKFHPDIILLTGIETDHLDYFKDYEDIREAFCEYGRSLSRGGTLLYCADQPGASEVADLLGRERQDLNLVPYGFGADGDFGIPTLTQGKERSLFKVFRWNQTFSLKIPGRHTVENAAGALALIDVLSTSLRGRPITPEEAEVLAQGLEGFSGSRRRSEILGEAGGILFMDDYGHHPSAIKTTLRGLKDFYPHRRLVVDFMSHTYSRTAALFSEFADSFSDADMVIFHKIYDSAREKPEIAGQVTGRALFEAVKDRRPGVYYTENLDQGRDLCGELLKEGDLFLTMGAGDNWTLGQALYEERRSRENL